MASAIAGVVGPTGESLVSTKGGEVLTVTGNWPSGLTLTAHLGYVGDSSDPPCYFGFGEGYSGTSETVSGNEVVQVVAPPLEKGSATLTLVADQEITFPVTVVERNWPGALHQMRRNFPPWKALGARRLDSEDLE